MIDLTDSDLDRVLNIGVSLSKERNLPKLLDAILTEAMEITHCDAGTLYLHEDNQLKFEIMRNHSMKTYWRGVDNPVDLPPVAIREENVCAYVLLHRSLENIDDVYSSKRFDFSGPRNYDQMTGYRTRSMLVIPLEDNRGEVTGVLQLINAMDEHGHIISFDQKFEKVFRAIASQAAIAVTNMKYLRENQELLQSLVEVLAAAIDERSHYNASHTKNVVNLVRRFVDFINQQFNSGRTSMQFTEEEKEQIVMSAWLHDIGKIVTPLEIMDKSTRLGAHLPFIEMRFDTIYAAENVRFLKGEISQEEWEQVQKEIAEARDLCRRVNHYDVFALEEEQRIILTLGKRQTTLPTGQAILWLEPVEVEELTIHYGTLTVEERKIMEEHVMITSRLLQKIKFSSQYRDVPTFAGGHHEKLNGTGYPRGLQSESLPVGTRILTVMDIFEALTAEDRPYKKSMSIEDAVKILDEMVNEGQLDRDLVRMLKLWQFTELLQVKQEGEE